jgi:hypothetical protein
MENAGREAGSGAVAMPECQQAIVSDRLLKRHFRRLGKEKVEATGVLRIPDALKCGSSPKSEQRSQQKKPSSGIAVRPSCREPSLRILWQIGFLQSSMKSDLRYAR